MLLGDPSVFAIESGITHAYNRLSFRALGYFVFHIRGHRFGVRKPDASMLALALDAVEYRINRRGTHIAPFAAEPDAGAVADAFRHAIYAPDDEVNLFGMSQSEMAGLVISKHLEWESLDQVFDDGSYVLQFDSGDQVRLIAFKARDDWRHNPSTLRDVWMSADDFYELLQQWRDAFIDERAKTPKAAES
jgi:hypothetical protein